MAQRFFTPGTAREALETCRDTAETLCKVYRAMELTRPEAIDCDQSVDPVYFRMVRVFSGALRSLQDAGVQVKDPRAGLLDFPARRAGRVVLLCWKVGEPTLGFWHEVEAGFAGRLAIDEEGPWDDRGSPGDAPS